MGIQSIDNPKRIEFDCHRWYVVITVTDAEGAENVYYASADSGITYGDGIWFGTKAEYEEERE